MGKGGGFYDFVSKRGGGAHRIDICYWVLQRPRARPSPSAPRRDKLLSLSFDAVPGAYYDILASSNLLSWDVLRTLRADSPNPSWLDTNSAFTARFYRVADWSGLIVVEGDVRSEDGRGVPDSCPFCDILVSSSLDSSIAYTDSDGHYVLRTHVAASITNFPFTLSFSKLGFRAHSVTVANISIPRLDMMSLTGPSNNDFTNRIAISGSVTNYGDNTQADVEEGETGLDPSVWYSFTAPADGTLRFAIDTTDFLPVIDIFKGESPAALQPLQRGVISNWVEWRIEVTRDLTVYAGEQFQIRVGALQHPTRQLSGGSFEWRAAFEPDFPLVVGAWNTNEGAIYVSPPPNTAQRYAPGHSVTLTAVPAPNYIFIGWSGSITGSQPAVTLTMDEAKEVAGTFQLANGNFANAIILTGEEALAEAFVPLNGSVWYEWKAPRDMPVAIGWDTTNFLHGAVYSEDEEGRLTHVASNNGNRSLDHLDTRFWAVAGVTYKVGINFEANEAGQFRLRLYEPIVLQASISGGYRISVSISASFTNLSFSQIGGSVEIWTRIQNTPAFYPYTVTVRGDYYHRVTGGIVYSNTQHARYALTYLGPPNNDFSNATQIAASEGSISGTYLAADREAGEEGLGDASIWYAFHPPTNGTFFITANLRSTIDVSGWEGTTVAGLQPVIGMLRDQNGVTAITEWTAHAGRILYIRCSGGVIWSPTLSLQYKFVPDYPLYLSSDQPLAARLVASPTSDSSRYPADALVTVSAELAPHYQFGSWIGHVSSAQNTQHLVMQGLAELKASFWLANDAFSQAQVMSGLPAAGSGANLYASAESNEPDQGPWPAASSVWFRWTAPAGGDVSVDFDFNDATVVATIFTGSSLETLKPIANNLAGRNVRAVGFTAEGGTTYYLSVDAFGGDGGQFAFTINPVVEARYILNLLPSPGGYVEQTPAPDGNAEFAAGTEVALRARPVNASTFVCWEELTRGTPVDLGEDAIITVKMDRHRIIRPLFAPGSPRLNDNFADRQILIADEPMVVATNIVATMEPGEPAHAVNQSGRSLWWSWTSPTTAPVAFTTYGSSFSNVAVVYRGSSLEELTDVAAGAPGLGSTVSFIAEAGITYHIAVDGIDGWRGVIRLRAAGNEQFFTQLLYPNAGQSWADPALLPIRGQAINSELTVTQINLLTNGAIAFSTSGPFLDTVLTNPPLGPLLLALQASDENGRIVMSETVTNYIHGYRFTTNNFVGAKSNGVVVVSIMRAPPNNYRSEVFLDMLPDTAVPGIHYTPLRGPVLFLPGESVRSVRIPVLPGPILSNNPVFHARLSSSDGSPITDTAAVTILNESPFGSTVWIDDTFPAGSSNSIGFLWISNNPAPFSGIVARRSAQPHGYTAAPQIFPGTKVLWQDVYLIPGNAPRVVALRIQYLYGSYTTVYWGDRSLINPGDLWLGPLPEQGIWRQLAISKNYFSSQEYVGLTWISQGGTTVWDRTGTWP